MSDAKHVLVTGGAGFIGSHLVDRLLAAGQHVVVLDDFSTGRKENLAAASAHPHFRLVTGQVSAHAELPALVAQSSFVFHLAAVVGVDLVMREPVRTIHENLRETEALLNAASAAQTPVLLASTSEVYGKSQKGVFAETDDLLIGPPYLHRWSYACSKLMDEFLALAHAKERGLPVTIVRLFNTVGPRQSGHYGMVLPRFIASARKNEPLKIHGDGAQTRCFCHVQDTVEALLRLQQTPAARGEIFNVGNDTEITIRELAEQVIRSLGSRSALEFIPYATAYGPGFEDMLRRKPSLTKLEQTTGFRPRTPLETIIRETAANIG